MNPFIYFKIINNVNRMFNRVIFLKNSFSLVESNYRKMSSSITRIGVCQLNTRDSKEENFKIGEQLIKQAKSEQAKVSLKSNKTDFLVKIYSIGRLFS